MNLLKRGLALLGLALYLGACSTETDVLAGYPSPDLGEAEMAAIIVDIHLIEAALTEVLPGPAKDSTAQRLYLKAFHLHQIDGERFERNMQAYLRRPQALDRIYEKAQDKLKEMEIAHPNPQG